MNKEKKDILCNNCFNTLNTYCTEYKIWLRKINDRQFRMELGHKKVDVYPLSNKYFDLTAEKWGTYTEVIEFIDEYFSQE